MKVYSHFVRVSQGPVAPWWLGLPMRDHWGRVHSCDIAPHPTELGLLVFLVSLRPLRAETSQAALVQPLCHHHAAAPSRTGCALAPKHRPSAVGTSPGSSPRGGRQRGMENRHNTGAQQSYTCGCSCLLQCDLRGICCQVQGEKKKKWPTVLRSSYSLWQHSKASKEGSASCSQRQGCLLKWKQELVVLA